MLNRPHGIRTSDAASSLSLPRHASTLQTRRYLARLHDPGGPPRGRLSPHEPRCARGSAVWPCRSPPRRSAMEHMPLGIITPPLDEFGPLLTDAQRWVDVVERATPSPQGPCPIARGTRRFTSTKRLADWRRTYFVCPVPEHTAPNCPPSVLSFPSRTAPPKFCCKSALGPPRSWRCASNHTPRRADGR